MMQWKMRSMVVMEWRSVRRDSEYSGATFGILIELCLSIKPADFPNNAGFNAKGFSFSICVKI